MDLRTTYPILAQYNQWMNQKLYAVCAEIPDVERKADRGAFFQSIHGTLNHILYGDRRWMARFTNTTFVGKLGEDLYADFDALRTARCQTDEEILAWSQQLEESWLRQPFEWTSGIDGAMHCQPAWVLVTHLFNHQIHHRGQLTTLLTQLNYDLGCTDLPWMPHLCWNAESDLR
ncbi:MAG TPA: DinB family protein [Stenomitos sp.]